MGAVPQNKDLYARLERLERTVNNMQRQSTLTSASISEGNLTVRRGGNVRVIDGGDITVEDNGAVVIGENAALVVQSDAAGDSPVVTVGDLYHRGNFIGRGMRVMDRTGKLIFIAAENLVDESNWIGIFDGREHEIVHADRISGYGLAGPRMAYPWLVDEFPEGWRTRETTDWGTLYDMRVPAIHPKIRFQLAFATSGTPGQFRLLLDGDAVWTSDTLTSSGVQDTTVTVSDIPDINPNKIIHIEFQVRAAGDGTVWARPLMAIGQGT